MEDGGRMTPMAVELVDRLAIFVVVRHSLGMVGAESRSLRSNSYVRMQHFVRRSTNVPFRRFFGDVRREFMQRLSTDLRGTLGSYVRDALHSGSDDSVACFPVPRAWACRVFSSFLFFAWWLPFLFLIKKYLVYSITLLPLLLYAAKFNMN
jgi:hypothetical protein